MLLRQLLLLTKKSTKIRQLLNYVVLKKSSKSVRVKKSQSVLLMRLVNLLKKMRHVGQLEKKLVHIKMMMTIAALHNT